MDAQQRIRDLEEALMHLLEVQTAPSFDKPHESDTKAMQLYKMQEQEWAEAVHDARSVLRG